MGLPRLGMFLQNVGAKAKAKNVKSKSTTEPPAATRSVKAPEEDGNQMSQKQLATLLSTAKNKVIISFYSFHAVK